MTTGRYGVLVSALAVVAALVPVAAQSQDSAIEPTLTFAGLGGTVQTGYGSCVITGFEAKYGVTVEYVAGQTAENMAKVLAQRANQTIDVYMATDADQFRGAQMGLFEPINVEQVPNLSKVQDFLRDEYGVPIDYTMAGIGYQTDVFERNGWAPPTSWLDLWDPKYSGHATVYTASITFGIGLIELIASLEGGGVDNLDPGFAKLAALKPNLYAVITSQAQLDQALTSEAVYIGVNSTQRALLAKQQGVPVEFVQPKEGVIRTYRYVNVVENAPHPNAARAFLNWMLEPEVQDCIAETIVVSPVLPGAHVPAGQELYYTPATPPHATDWAALLAQFDDVVARWADEIEAQ